MSRTRLHTELSKMLSEIEQEINEHPIREKLKIWKWIVYCYLTNNKFINKIKTIRK